MVPTTRFRLLAGGLGVFAGALGLGSCGTVAKTATMVPWVALAPVSRTTTTSTSTTLAPAAECRARQLRASVGPSGAGLGNVVSTIVFTNLGSTCRLSGYPDLTGATATRRSGPIHVHKTGTYFGNLIPANLATGQRGLLLLGTSDGCAALNGPSQAQIRASQRANTYHQVTVVLPRGRGSLRANVTFDVACGLDESQLGVRAPTPDQLNAPAGTPQSLEATVRVAASVNAATTLHYVVALFNPTHTTVTWRTCPNYTESLFTTPLALPSQTFTFTYQLDCRAALAVRPGRTVTFRMELPIGHVRESAEAKFSWQLDTGYGPYAGRALKLTASQ
ncbi:MAG TPA: DUF4232 domain-containing protein [Acidimicrobiales bacterium]|nr:DUF4232 domain-containing protein [Acidimicrobiales bacterium]